MDVLPPPACGSGMWSSRSTGRTQPTSTPLSGQSPPTPPRSWSIGAGAMLSSKSRQRLRIRKSDGGSEGVSVSKKILVVEDDATTAEYVTKGFEQNGYVVDLARDGRDGLFHATDGQYAAIVLDRMLPGMDGLTVLRPIRRAGIATPAIILSALGSTDERVKGLRSGSDDYLAKPFAFSELLARVEALQRRGASAAGAVVTALSCADLKMDLLARRV